MRTHRLTGTPGRRWAPLACLLVLLLAGAAPLGAQLRQVVSSQISVSSRDAAIDLDFASGQSLEVAFRGGEVAVDGETLGSYARGGPLEGSWRSLLAEAVQLDDGPLARALVDWAPPEELDSEAAEVGRRIDRALEGALTAAEPPAEEQETPADRGEGVRTSSGQELGSLLRRTDRLEALADALEGLDLADVRIHLDEDVNVAEGEEVDATVILVDGDLDVRGTVDGSAVVTGGALRIYEGGRITGEVRLADARIFRNGGDIEGPVTNVAVERERAAEALEELENLGELESLDELEVLLGEDLEALDDLEDEIRERVRDELRDELRAEFRDRYRGPSIFSPLRSVGRGLAGLLQSIISFVIAVVLAGVVVHFFPDNLERVAEAARRSPARAGIVGIAGTFLLIPVWVLGMVALAISIVGIPALLAWIPLFPLAACLAAAFGYLAVARLVGGWVAEQGFQGLDFLRPSNTLHAAAAGLALFLLPYAAANVVEMAGPWLGFVEGLFLTVGWVAGSVAAAVGFGAVLLTRGGRQPGSRPPGEGWDDLHWPTDPEPAPGPAGGSGPDPTPGPATPTGDDEGWEDEWEELEREAKERADAPPEGEAADRRPRRKPGAPEAGEDADGAPPGSDADDGDDDSVGGEPSNG